jgi:hypothetical protein
MLPAGIHDTILLMLSNLEIVEIIVALPAIFISFRKSNIPGKSFLGKEPDAGVYYFRIVKRVLS